MSPEREFILLSREWCHLCQVMLDALEPIAREYGWVVRVVDVDLDPELEARWNELVPVLLSGDSELCHHRLDAEAVHAHCQRFQLKSRS